MKPNIQAIHVELLELLKRFHQICTVNRIQYSIHGGTMLGAVREKGFIPWDDDADITVTREEYVKLRTVLRGAVNSEFQFDENSRYPKIILMRKGAPLVWADIFIYDYITENRFGQKLKFAGIDLCILMTRTRVEQELSNARGIYHGITKLFMNGVVFVSHILPYRFRLHIANWFTQRLPGKRTLIHRSNDMHLDMQIIMPAYVMTEYLLTPFEDTELMMSVYYDEVLRGCYGKEYMTPRKQKTDEIHRLSVEAERQYFVDHFFGGGERHGE